MKLRVYITSVFIIVIFFSKTALCGNTVISFLNGRVIDERGFPIQGVKVIIENLEKLTDINGSFSFQNIISPYEVTIAERYTNTAVIYKELTVTNPDLVLFGDMGEYFANKVHLNIKISKISESSSSTIKFISTNAFTSTQEEVSEGDSLVKLTVSWPINRNSIEGELILIQKNDKGYQFLKRQNISLNKGRNNYEITFDTKKEKKLNSSNLKLFFYDKNYKINKLKLSLNFFNYDKNAEINLAEEYGNSSSIKIVIPDKFTESIKFRVTGIAESENGKGFISYNYASPEEQIKVVNETPPELETPLNNFLAVDGDTRFSYSSGTGAGIYVLEFKSFNPVMNFFIVTRERETYFRYLSRSEFNSANISFDWRVRKYITYFNTDDFVKPSIFKNDFSYKAVLYSQRRNFKTGYY
ncbi:MAG: hypothetical protein HGGPFJEG_01643 [Ignavibacteria bacterium]|nr:hypothetical protein [Ignavibacteria bacterium]